MDSHSRSESRQPTIGLVSLVCLVIGNMIGTGVYVSSGYSLADLKDAKYVLLVWVIAGIHAMCGAVAYAAVSRRLSVSGGEYAILSRWVHPAVGFLAAWISIIAGFAAPIALSGKLLGFYTLRTFDISLLSFLSTDRATLELLVASLVILLASSLHAIQISWNARATNFVVAIKLFGLLIFIAWGAFHLLSNRLSGNPETGIVDSGASISSTAGLMWGMLASLYFTTLCYTGFNASIYLAGKFATGGGTPTDRLEAVLNSASTSDGVPSEEDGRNSATDPIVGRSMVWACLIVTLIYLALNTLFLYSIPAAQVVGAGEAFVATVSRQIGGIVLEQIMNWVVLLSTATSVLAMTMTGPQVLLQIASDYRLKGYEIDSKGTGTHYALAIQTAITLLFVWSATIRGIATFLGLTLTVCGAIAIASLLIAVRRSRPRLLPLTALESLCSAIYVLGAVVLIAAGFWLVPSEFFASMITFAVGILLYFAAMLLRKSPRERAVNRP